MRSRGFRVIGFALLVAMLGCSSAKKDAGGSGQSSSGGGAGAGAGQAKNMNGGDPSASSGGSGGHASTPGGGGSAGMKSSDGAAGMKGSDTSGSQDDQAGAGPSAPPADVQAMLDPDVQWDALTLVFPEMYSAYDGVHTFQIPAHVDMTNIDLANWEAIPSDAVTFDPDPDVMGGVLITVVKGVEDITIAAHADKIGGTAPLHVTLATPEDWDIGEKRYHNGVDYMMPEFTFDQIIDPNWVPPPTPTDLACNNCHSTGAKYLEIQHTPTQIGGLSDETLTTIFTTGMKPAGVPYHVLPMQLEYLYPEFHTWEATDAERKGLIVYLRSLTPIAQGDIIIPDGLMPPMM